MLYIREQFDVLASPDQVWAVLADPYAVVGCVPGATIVGRNADGSFDAAIGVKFGPARVSFRARIALTLDPTARRGEFTAQGKDSVGGTRVRSTARFGVAARDGAAASMVSIEGQAEVSGRLASLIESGAAVVLKQLSAEFACCLAARCTPAAPSAHDAP